MDRNLNDLIQYWQSVKRMEQHYHGERITVENEIVEHLKANQLYKDSGTIHFDGLNIRTCHTRKWDHELLTHIKSQHQISDYDFPFKTEYKEIKAHSDLLEAKQADIWSCLVPALKIVPAKPYFFVPKKRA